MIKMSDGQWVTTSKCQWVTDPEGRLCVGSPCWPLPFAPTSSWLHCWLSWNCADPEGSIYVGSPSCSGLHAACSWKTQLGREAVWVTLWQLVLGWSSGTWAMFQEATLWWRPSRRPQSILGCWSNLSREVIWEKSSTDWSTLNWLNLKLDPSRSILNLGPSFLNWSMWTELLFCYRIRLVSELLILVYVQFLSWPRWLHVFSNLKVEL